MPGISNDSYQPPNPLENLIAAIKYYEETTPPLQRRIAQEILKISEENHQAGIDYISDAQGLALIERARQAEAEA
ncbi:hypothetical protein IDM48_04425 [Rothia amarae]|uniref:Uncharacterized protein n=1 Tax=Rothia amarae TaxID=169480 RepID=A0A7H2BLV7_9MICC|nr:hypothetical protein [Rothia amarae]QNV40653.1 hypothetical protein IDM48_04425 [Rothia amarae]